jgi:hypothetical protein
VETANIKEVSSFLSDLPTAVQRFWEGITAPLFELSISLVVGF